MEEANKLVEAMEEEEEFFHPPMSVDERGCMQIDAELQAIVDLLAKQMKLAAAQ
jgi:hypothetical protein